MTNLALQIYVSPGNLEIEGDREDKRFRGKKNKNIFAF